MDYHKHDYPRTCRYCGERRWAFNMIKYSTRCYACLPCYTKSHTLNDAARLPQHEREKLSLFRDEVQT